MKRRLSSKAIYAIEKQLNQQPNTVPLMLFFDKPVPDGPLSVSCLSLGGIPPAQVPLLLQMAAAAHPLPTAPNATPDEDVVAEAAG